ncbi:MAG: hypothetical protein EYC70_03430 [Planctomycetota bacterium]|nr:MAG: hypothetical protein EYC70_03430 [Planctomycetota bacterium]
MLIPLLILLFTPSAAAAPRQDLPAALHVDPQRGDDGADGSERRPLASLSAAVARLPDPVPHSVTIRLGPGIYISTGGRDMPDRSLQLMRRMRPDAVVRFEAADPQEPPVLAWNGENRMIEVLEGTWQFQNLQIGSFSTAQRRGLTVNGPAHVLLQDVAFRLRSNSDAGIWARYGGRVTLRGAIRLNEHLHDEAADESFCGILATEHGIIEFDQRAGASLELGNGNLAARGYGIIRLGCERARITCWTASNNLSIANGGRIDLRNTATTLRAALRNNTPIGLEHDGHILAEDAAITILGSNDSAIALQKASTFTCNDIRLAGDFECALWASSGSMFVGRFLSDIRRLEASTGAGIHVEKVEGAVIGPVVARSGGLVSLPDRVVRSD